MSINLAWKDRRSLAQVHVVRKESFPDLGQLSKDQLDTMPATVSFDSLASSLPDALRFDVQVPTIQGAIMTVESLCSDVCLTTSHLIDRMTGNLFQSSAGIAVHMQV
jgi:hypothetical protein